AFAARHLDRLRLIDQLAVSKEGHGVDAVALHVAAAPLHGQTLTVEAPVRFGVFTAADQQLEVLEMRLVRLGHHDRSRGLRRRNWRRRARARDADETEREEASHGDVLYVSRRNLSAAGTAGSGRSSGHACRQHY